MTNQDGKYSFSPSSLPPGSFNIRISDNNDLYSIVSATITKPPYGSYPGITSSTYSDLDFALRFPASVSGMVWYDENCDSIHQLTEPVLSPEMLAASSYPTAKTFVKAKNGSSVFNGELGSDGKYTVYVNYSGTIDLFVAPYSKNLVGSRWVPTFPYGGGHHTVTVADDFDTVTGKDFGFCKYYLLTVKKEGSGKVTSSPAGIDCVTATICEKYYHPLNTPPITLTAVPADGFMFKGWSDGCGVTYGDTATITMNGDKECTAKFENLTATLDDNLACIKGTGQGVGFSWMLKDQTGTNTLCSNDLAQTTKDADSSGVASDLYGDMRYNKQCPSNSVTYPGGYCINIGKNKLFIGKVNVSADCGADCQVSSTKELQFNPTIKLVSKQQMLTSIRGFLFNDSNGNALQDSQEAYLQGWTVVLKTPNGSEASAVSDASGFYEFTQISVAGDYSISVETRPDVTYTTSQAVVRKVDGVNIPMIASFGIKVTEPYTLTVSTIGSGVVSGTGITCGTDCSEQYNQGTAVTLTAIGSQGYAFSQWSGSGSCSGTSPTVNVTMDSNKSCTATFAAIPTYTLTLANSANGKVSGGGNYPAGATVHLVANPNEGFSFKGWSPSPCADSFVIPANNLTCTATFEPIMYALNLQKTGEGTIKSIPAGIDCGNYCSGSYASGTEINLIATPSNGFSFTAWSGSCSGSTNSITVKMDSVKSCVANFTAIPTYTLSLVKSGNGIVTSSPAGVNCGNDCSESYSSGTAVSLIANADSGYYFAGWSGSCSSGTSSVATVTMDDSKSCTATFISNLTGCNAAMLASKLSVCNNSYIDCITIDNPDEAACDAAKKACHTEAQTHYGLCYQLSISKEGTGKGTVQSVGGLGTPISCGSTCESSFAYEDYVTLTATADSGSEFTGWTGDCNGNNTTITVNMNWIKNCQATFTINGVVEIMGDIDGKGTVDLADAILTLQILAGINPPDVNVGADVNNDGRIGLEEVVYILPKVAGLR